MGVVLVAIPNPVTDEDREQVRALHAAGLGRNEIAREIGRSGETVSKIAKALGLSFERGPEVAAATAAKVADAKARRAQLMHELLDDAERLRVQLFAPTTIHSFGGKENTYNSKDVDQPLFRDQRDIIQSVSTAITASIRLDQHDADTGADGAKSMLGALAAGLQVAYDQLQQDEGEPNAGGD